MLCTCRRRYATTPLPTLCHLQRVVRWQRAMRHQGTHSTKTRSTVHGSGRKIRPQKGTGMARAGARTAPNFRVGGKVFGPLPRSHAHSLPKKVRACVRSTQGRPAHSRRPRVRGTMRTRAPDSARVRSRRWLLHRGIVAAAAKAAVPCS